MRGRGIVGSTLIGAILIFLPCLPTGRPGAARGQKIGIMKFDVAGDLSPSLGNFLYNALLERMVAARKYTVVDWEEIDRVLRYIAKSQPNISPEEARKQAISQLGLEKMYLGSLSKIGSKYYITVKVLNLDLSVDRVENASTQSEDGLQQAVHQVAEKLVRTYTGQAEYFRRENAKLRAQLQRTKQEVEKAKRDSAAFRKKLQPRQVCIRNNYGKSGKIVKLVAFIVKPDGTIRMVDEDMSYPNKWAGDNQEPGWWSFPIGKVLRPISKGVWDGYATAVYVHVKWDSGGNFYHVEGGDKVGNVVIGN